tara:strand:- start:65 stop:472 length:408 start_codon:yes stop_codon:yes gene_type:complete
MSEFTKGVYQLHAIDEHGTSEYFDQSGVLKSAKQLEVWFESSCKKYDLPESSKWYALDASDPRFKEVSVFKEKAETSKKQEVSEFQYSENAYNVSDDVTNRIVLAYEKDTWTMRNEKRLQTREGLLNYISDYFKE